MKNIILQKNNQNFNKMKKFTFLFLGLSFIMVSLISFTKIIPEKKMKIETKYGKIIIKLYNETPKHRDNFIKLVKQGYFDGTLFHRVINKFMIQGGDPDSKNAKFEQALGSGGPGYTVPAEFVSKYFHKKGALAAARLGDGGNPKKESSGSQFYIVQGKTYSIAELDNMETMMGKKFTPEQRLAYSTIGGTPHLDGSYTVFGEVIEGMDVIDKIANAKTAPGDRPIENISMTIKMIK